MSTSQRWLLFWGCVLLLLGLLFGLKALGLIENVLGYFWAGFLLLAGIWLVVSAFLSPPTGKEEAVRAVVGLQGARRASLEFDHGVGQIRITGGAPPDVLLMANRGTGLKVSSQLEGDLLKVKVDCGPSFVPFIGPESGVWTFRLNEEIPLNLKVDSGASQVTLDLSNLQVVYFGLEGGASSVTLIPPARVTDARMDIEAGVANLNIRVPEGVAARIRLKESIGMFSIDQQRFPLLEERIYQSVDYDQAAYRVELILEAGLSSVTVR